MGALSVVSNRPHWGLVFDMEAFDRMIESDKGLREDYRYAKPMVNIEGFGSVEAFKGYNFIHEWQEPRFAFKSDDGTTATLRRVDPFLESTTGMEVGERVDVNQAYINAEFALAIIFIKNVYEAEIPPAGPSNPGGGTEFGTTPDLQGEWHWLNIQNEETNPLRENGFYFARMEGFAKPLDNDEEAIAILYRRCPQTEYADCSIGGDDAVEGPVTATTMTDLSGSDVAATAVMESIMDREASESVTVTADGSPLTAVIGDSDEAPTYILIYQSKADRDTATGASAVTVDW